MSLQKKYTVFVAVIIAIACAVVPWLYLPYSEPFLVDEGYQAMCVKYYQKSPMAMLTFYIGNLWMSCFGDEFLTLRYLSCLLGSLAVTAGSLYFFLRTKNVLWTLLVFSLSMLGCAIERNICYDWDVGAIPFYVLGAITSVEFIRTPKYRNAFFAGASLACVLLARLQLAVLVPVFIGIIYIAGYKDQNLWNILSYLCGVILVFVVVTSLMCGSVENYFSAFTDENIITGHSLRNIDRWWYIVKDMYWCRFVQSSAMTIAVGIALWWSCKVGSRGIVISRFVMGIILLSLIGIGFGITNTMRINGVLGIYAALSSLTITLLLMLPGWNMINSIKQNIPIYSLVVLWIWFLAQAFGSDYWFVKDNGFFIIPVIGAVIYPYLCEVSQLQRFGRLLFMASFICMAFIAVGRIYAGMTYSNKPLGSFNKLSGLYGSYEGFDDWSRTRQIVASIETTGTKRICIDGVRYSFAYSMQKAPVFNHNLYHSNDLERSVSGRSKVMNDYDAWLFVFITDNDYKEVRQKLENNGFFRVWSDAEAWNDGYILYMKQPFADKYIHWLEQNNCPYNAK